MKNYIVHTRRVARFLYNVNAESIEQAEQAALAMMDSEQYTETENGYSLDYEHEIVKSGEFNADSEDFSFPNDYGISAAKVLDLYEDGIDGRNCEDVWDYIEQAYKGETV